MPTAELSVLDRAAFRTQQIAHALVGPALSLALETTDIEIDAEGKLLLPLPASEYDAQI